MSSIKWPSPKIKERLPSAQKDRVGAKETNARKRKGQAIPPALSFAAALFVPLGPVVRFAEHLAVADVRCAALAPYRHMVGVHFAFFVNPLGVGVISDGAQRAEGFLPLPVIALFDYAVGFKDMIQLVIGECA